MSDIKPPQDGAKGTSAKSTSAAKATATQAGARLPAKGSELGKPLLWSVLVHVGVVGVLAAGMVFQPQLPNTPMQVQLSDPNLSPDEEIPAPDDFEAVQAVAVDQAAVERQVQAINERKQAQAAAEQQRQAELERRAEAARKARERELRELRELEAKQEAERRKLAEERTKAQQEKAAAEKAAADAEARRKREEAAAAKAEQERKEREAEAKRLEQERLEREREAKERAERERQLQERLAAEAAERAKARQAQMQSEIQRFTALITGAIQRNWIVDDSMRGKECQLTISLAPSGFVKSVDQGVGDERVCQSARTAVLKAGTLPVSKDPEVYKQMETIKLTVRPNL